jgi:hypothetical protein
VAPGPEPGFTEPIPVVAPDLFTPEPVVPDPAPAAPKPQRARKRKPEVPGWEDVLLGVRSGTQQ